MNFEFVIVWKTAAILAWASLGALAMKRESATARHAIWVLTLGAILAVPLIAAVAPSLDLPLLPAVQPVQGTLSASLPVESVNTAVMADGAGVFSEVPVARSSVSGIAGLQWDWRSRLALVWALGSLVIALKWIRAVWDLRLMKRRSVPVLCGPPHQLVTDLRRELNITTEVVVRIGNDSAPPMTWGIFRPIVLLPASVTEWTLDRCRAVLAHELAHVKRRDSWVRLLTQLACMVYWFNPLVWYAVHRLEIERERACDDCVLRLGANATDYAAHLVAIARGLNFNSPAASSMARPSQLKFRLEAILDPRTRRRLLSPLGRISLISGGAMLTILVAAIHVTPLLAIQTYLPALLPTPPVAIAGQIPETFPLPKATIAVDKISGAWIGEPGVFEFKRSGVISDN